MEDKKPEKNFFDYLGEGMHLQNANRSLAKFKEEYFQFGEYELKKYQEFVKTQFETGKITYGCCGDNFSITFIPARVYHPLRAGPSHWNRNRCYCQVL